MPPQDGKECYSQLGHTPTLYMGSCKFKTHAVEWLFQLHGFIQYRQILLYARVMFLKNVVQIKHKISFKTMYFGALGD